MRQMKMDILQISMSEHTLRNVTAEQLHRGRWKNLDKSPGRDSGIHEHVGIHRRIYERAGKTLPGIP